MAASQLGKTINTQPGSSTTITTGDKFDVVHTVVREMPASMAQRWVTQHPHYEAVLTVNDVLVRHTDTSISYDVGNMATVTYTYKLNPTEGGGSSTETPTGGGLPGFAGGSIDAFYDLDVATESVTILDHPRYRGVKIADNERQILSMMIQQGPLDADGNALKAGIVSARGTECANKIEGGIISFEAPVYIWRETTRSIGAGKLGKIDTPPGPVPNIGGGNWLYMGMSGKWADSYLIEVTRTWKSSVYGSDWDSDLYSAT